MTREEIDAIWQKAMHSAIKANEPSTRYEFDNLILEKVAEKMLTLDPDPGQWAADSEYVKSLAVLEGAEAIRSMKV